MSAIEKVLVKATAKDLGHDAIANLVKSATATFAGAEYLPACIVAIWADLSVDARLVAYLCAKELEVFNDNLWDRYDEA